MRIILLLPAVRAMIEEKNTMYGCWTAVTNWMHENYPGVLADYQDAFRQDVMSFVQSYRAFPNYDGTPSSAFNFGCRPSDPVRWTMFWPGFPYTERFLMNCVPYDAELVMGADGHTGFCKQRQMEIVSRVSMARPIGLQLLLTDFQDSPR